RDRNVTGVQTCALPICASLSFCINMFAPCNCSNCCQLLAVDLAAPLPPPSLAFGHWPRNTFAPPFRLASLVPRFHSDWFNRARRSEERRVGTEAGSARQ